jgi:hypothetical protein
MKAIDLMAMGAPPLPGVPFSPDDIRHRAQKQQTRRRIAAGGFGVVVTVGLIAALVGVATSSDRTLPTSQTTSSGFRPGLPPATEQVPSLAPGDHSYVDVEHVYATSIVLGLSPRTSSAKSARRGGERTALGASRWLPRRRQINDTVQPASQQTITTVLLRCRPIQDRC